MGIRRSRVLDQTRRNEVVQGRVDFLYEDWVHAMGPGSVRCPAFRDLNLRWQQKKKGSNPSWNHKKFAVMVDQPFDGQRDYVPAIYLERNA